MERAITKCALSLIAETKNTPQQESHLPSLFHLLHKLIHLRTVSVGADLVRDIDTTLRREACSIGGADPGVGSVGTLEAPTGDLAVRTGLSSVVE